MLELVKKEQRAVFIRLWLSMAMRQKSSRASENLLDSGIASEVPIATFGSVIGTHL